MSFAIWQFLAGVALFIYAMGLVENSLKHLAGRSFKKFLKKHSQSRFKVIASTTVITALLQSSSVVILMVLTFVGAGLLKLPDALAASLGSNLGTTIDSWVIAVAGFKINFFKLSFPLLAISLIGLLVFERKTRASYLTTFIIGCAFLFIGLEWMKQSIDKSLFQSLGDIRHYHYLIFFPIGLIITGIIQSSSATIAVTLTILNSGIIPFEHAVSMMLGSEVGSTIKFLLGSLGGMPDKKRVAWGNFFMNLIAMVTAAVLLWPIINFTQNVLDITDPLTGLVAIQTGVNAISIILFLPLLNVIAKLMERVIKSDEGAGLTTYIHTKTAALPGDSLELAEKEIQQIIVESVSMNKRIIGIKNTDVRKDGIFTSGKEGNFDEKYEKLKILHGEVLEYLSSIGGDEMDKEEAHRKEELLNIVRHLLRAGKNMKDVRHNLEEFESSGSDLLFEQYQQVQKETGEFYSVFLNHVQNKTQTEDDIRALLKENQREYEGFVSGVLALTTKSQITNLESSNLLNVYREIYSSNKALILSLAELRSIDV